MYLGGRGGEVAGSMARAHTPLEQLLDEIKFQRRKELRSFSQVRKSNISRIFVKMITTQFFTAGSGSRLVSNNQEVAYQKNNQPANQYLSHAYYRVIMQLISR
jgi:hypothetical protein